MTPEASAPLPSSLPQGARAKAGAASGARAPRAGSWGAAARRRKGVRGWGEVGEEMAGMSW